MTYICLKKKKFQMLPYKLIPLRKRDIFLIKGWRNSQIEYLRQNKYLSNKEQINYYREVIFPSFSLKKPKLILFSFLYNNDCIGYGGLTNVDWNSKRAELSFIVNPERAKSEKKYCSDFSSFLKLIKAVAFKELNLNRLFTETFDLRPLHVELLEKEGFLFEGRLKKHVYKNNRFVDSIIHGYLKEYDRCLKTRHLKEERFL